MKETAAAADVTPVAQGHPRRAVDSCIGGQSARNSRPRSLSAPWMGAVSIRADDLEPRSANADLTTPHVVLCGQIPATFG